MPQHTSAVDPLQVIVVGATGLRQLAGSSAEILEALQLSYGQAVRRTLILGLAGICFATCVAPFMEWINIKEVAARRSQDAGGLTSPTEERLKDDSVTNEK